MRYFSIAEESSGPDTNVLKEKEVGKTSVTNSRTRRKAQTRERILKAANVLFHKQGYEVAKTTDLAARVGVSHGTIFAHFDSKASILRELVIMRMRQDLEELRNTEFQGEDAIEKLKDYARILWGRAHSAPELTTAYHAQSWNWSPVEEREYRELVEGGLLLARNIVQEGVERGEISSDINVELTLEILQAQYFDSIRQAQYGLLCRVEGEEEAEIECADLYLEQFEETIDYLLSI